MSTRQKITVCVFIIVCCMTLVNAVTILGHNSSDGSVVLEIYSSPVTENIGALDLHIQLKTPENVSDVIAASPESGSWSQICPAITRSGNTISITAAAPTILLSSDTLPMFMFALKMLFSGSQKTYNTINEFADSIWIEKAFSTSGYQLTNSIVTYSAMTAIQNKYSEKVTTNSATITHIGDRYKFSFNLATKSLIIANVVNAGGIIVQKISNDYVSAGTHTLSWNCRQLSSGIYFIQLSTGSMTYNKKITYIR